MTRVGETVLELIETGQLEDDLPVIFEAINRNLASDDIHLGDRVWLNTVRPASLTGARGIVIGMELRLLAQVQLDELPSTQVARKLVGTHKRIYVRTSHLRRESK